MNILIFQGGRHGDACIILLLLLLWCLSAFNVIGIDAQFIISSEFSVYSTTYQCTYTCHRVGLRTIKELIKKNKIY